MTEMTKKVKSPTWEQLPEVYGLAVILVICVIGGVSSEYRLSGCVGDIHITLNDTYLY